MDKGIKLFLNKIKSLNIKYLLIGIVLLFLLVELLLFINNSVSLSNSDVKNLFEYVVQIRSSSECLDKIFERAEVNVKVMTDSISGSYDVSKLQDKNYNLHFVKDTDSLVKSVLNNTPSITGAWFQLNSDFPFSVQVFNWYEFKDNQFINLNQQLQGTPSMDRKLNPQDDPYYFNAIDNNGLVWSNYKDADTGEPLLTVSAPVYNVNTLIGVAGVDISIDNLNQALSNIHLILNNVDLYLLDEHYNLILSQMANGSPSSGDEKLLEKIKINKDVPVDYYKDSAKRTAISITLTNDYKLIVSVEDAAVFAGENSLITIAYVLFSLFILALVFILLLLWQMKNMQQKVNLYKNVTPPEQQDEE